MHIMSIAEVPKESDLTDFLVNKGNGVKGFSLMNLQSIPQKFIQPHQERLHFSLILLSESIPVLDISNLDDPKVAESICDAAEKWVFFQIVNRGIPIEVLENVIEAGHKFFELPVEERRKYLKENSPTHTVQLKTSFSPLAEKVLEWKDYLFHIYDSDDDESTKLWLAVSKDQVLEYMKWAKPIIAKLLEVLLESLNVKHIDEPMKSVVMGTLILNLIHYPVCPSPELTAGAGHHADVFSITMLLQDDVGGLYVGEPKGDDWIHVPPVKGALVINIRDILQIMSNDRYKSIKHRVIVSASRNRVSVPIFVNPAPDVVFGPLKQVLKNGEKPLYKQVVYSDYFNYFFSKGHEGKQTIEFAKL